MFKDYIVMNALRNKKLKPLARSIGYPLGFFRVGQRVRLTNELVYLNTFLGTVALRFCLSKYPDIEQKTKDEIVEVFTKKLLSAYFPKSMFPVYEQRLGTWGNLFREFEDLYQYAKDMSQLVTTFYQYLTKTPCDEMKEAMLSLRFNAYMGLFIGSITKTLEDVQFVQ